MKKLLLIVFVSLLLAGCTAGTVNTENSPTAKERESVAALSTAAVVTEPVPIGEDEAVEIALNHAGLNRGAVKSISVQFDSGEGEYEVYFFTKGIEYEYEIDAYTGAIRDAD